MKDLASARRITHLGDFTTTARLLPIAALAVVIGVFAAYVAAALLKLIGFFTNVPVVDDDRRLVGVITRGGLREWIERNRNGDRQQPLGDAIHHDPVVAFGDEPLRLIVYRMADKGVTRLPVVSRADRTLIGMLALTDLLGARARILDAERRRERVLGTRLRLPTMFGGRSDSAA
jgi:CBS domain-containing protein